MFACSARTVALVQMGDIEWPRPKGWRALTEPEAWGLDAITGP